MRFDRKRLLLWLMVAFTATPVVARAQGAAYPPGPGSGVGGSFTGGTITAPILGPIEGCLAPAYSFTGAPTSGLCSILAGSIKVQSAIAGNRAQVALSGGGADLEYITAGNVTNEFSMGFSAALIGFGGVTNMTWTPTEVTSTVPFLAPDGSYAAPSHSFSGKPSMGAFRDANTFVLQSGDAGVADAAALYLHNLGWQLDFNASGSDTVDFLGDSTSVRVRHLVSGVGGATLTVAATSSSLEVTSDAGGSNTQTLTPVSTASTVTDGVNSTNVTLLPAEIDFKTDTIQRASITNTAITSTLPVLLPLGSVSTPSIATPTGTNTGIFFSAATIMDVAAGGSLSARFSAGGMFITGTSGVDVNATGAFRFSSGTAGSGAADTFIVREAAATIQMGNDVNGAAVAQTIKACDGITGTDIAGCDQIVAGGRGTGAGAPGNLRFQTATTLGTGTTAQTLTTRLTIAPTAITSTLPILGPAGLVGAPTYSFSGDPDSGLYSVAGNNVGIAVGGAERYRFGSGGLLTIAVEGIGIGTSAGSPDVGLVRPGAGVVRASNGSTGLGALIGGVSVEANTGTKAPTVIESGELYTNTGDADGSTINLPDDPTIGTIYTVTATVAQNITLAPAAGETVMFGNVVCGTSFVIGGVATGIGDSVTVIAATGGSGAVWITTAFAGTPVCTP